MHVLHVLQPVDGGVPVVVAQLVRAQEAAGWRVTVAAPMDVATGSPHVRWRASRAPGPSSVTEAVRLARIVRDVAPDAIHLHSSKAGLAGRLAVRGRVPTLFQPHGWSFLALDGPAAAAARRWERTAARWSARILCCSPGEARQGERAGIDACFEVVQNPVDLERFRPGGRAERAAARSRLGVGDGPVAVCVGRLAPAKGQDLLVQAWPQVRAALPDAVVVLVGDGPDRRRLEAAAGAGVRFTGHHEAVPDWLHAADVVVQPSRYEAQSLAVLEAMASGRSVVATDVDGMADAIGEGGGALVPRGDGRALAAAIVVRLTEPDRAAAEGAVGRQRAERDHDPAVWAARICTLTANLRCQ